MPSPALLRVVNYLRQPFFFQDALERTWNGTVHWETGNHYKFLQGEEGNMT